MPTLTGMKSFPGASACGSAAAHFVRAFSKPVAVRGLIEPGEDRTVIDALYERVRARLIDSTGRSSIRNIEVAMLLTPK